MKRNAMKPLSFLVVLLCGALFGLGLSVAQMIRPEVVLAFLLQKDLGLLLVLGGAVMVTLLGYQILPRLIQKPVLEGKFGKHAAQLDKPTLLGAALFGIGWGISGVCPGPALAAVGTGDWTLLVAVAAMFAGAYVQGAWASTE
jgi:uncharacterized protein